MCAGREGREGEWRGGGLAPETEVNFEQRGSESVHIPLATLTVPKGLLNRRM